LDELTTIKGELVKMYKQIEEEEARKKRIEEAKKREVIRFYSAYHNIRSP
jgi:hypothetical protein